MKKYKIGTFAKYMGVSPDLVKHYQDSGILKPEVDPENNYRYYNMTHGERLIVSRKFRNLGFSVEETSNLISNKTGIDIYEMLTARKIELAEEIKLLQEKYDSIIHLQENCHLFLEEKNKFFICDRPGYYYLEHVKHKGFLDGENLYYTVQELMKVLPTTLKLMVFSQKYINGTEIDDFSNGLGLREDYIDLIDPSCKNNMTYFPPGKAVAYIYSKPHESGNYPRLKDIIESAKLYGFKILNQSIILENGIDFYENGQRFENYLIYLPI